MADGNDGRIVCPRTKEIFHIDETEKVFVMWLFAHEQERYSTINETEKYFSYVICWTFDIDSVHMLNIFMSEDVWYKRTWCMKCKWNLIYIALFIIFFIC